MCKCLHFVYFLLDEKCIRDHKLFFSGIHIEWLITESPHILYYVTPEPIKAMLPVNILMSSDCLVSGCKLKLLEILNCSCHHPVADAHLWLHGGNIRPGEPWIITADCYDLKSADYMSRLR